MTLAKKIIKNTSILSGSNFVARFLSFLAVFLIIRELSLYEYGLLTLAMAITGPVAAFAGMGLDSIFVSDTSRFLGQKNEKSAKKLIISFIRNKVIITILLLIGGWFIKGILEAQYGELVSLYFVWLAIWVVVQALKTITDLLSQIYERFGVLSVANIVEVVVKLAVVLIFLKTVGLSVVTVLLVYIISKFSAFIFSIFPIAASLKHLSSVVTEKQSVIWSIVKRHGKWDILRNIFSDTTNSIKPWIIKFFLGTESVAIFSLAQTIYSVISQALPLKNIILPIVVKRIEDKNTASLILQKANKYSIFFYLLATAAFLICGEYLVSIFFPKYLASVFLIKLMLLLLFVTTVSAYQGILLYGFRQQKVLLFNDFIMVASRLGLLPLWLMYFGVSGAVFEMLLASLFSALFFEYFLRRKFKISTWHWKNLYIFDHYDKWFLQKIITRLRPYSKKN